MENLKFLDLIFLLTLFFLTCSLFRRTSRDYVLITQLKAWIVIDFDGMTRPGMVSTV